MESASGANPVGGDPLRNRRPQTESLLVGISALCATAVRLTGVDGAAVAVLSSTSPARELVYATDAIAQQVDELQFVLGEGPCVDAYFGGHPELWPDLSAAPAVRRWPAFAREAGALGVCAAFAFPVPGLYRPIGVLELYRGDVGALAVGGPESAAACAIAVGNTLEATWIERAAAAGGVEQAIEISGLDDASDAAARDFSRSEVYIASGMVAVQLTVSTTEALDRLRAYAYAQERSITEVAADIVARRLSLRKQDDMSEGQGA